MRKIICTILVLIIGVNIPFSTFASESSTPPTISSYEYPLSVNSNDWSSYSVIEKVELLKIPTSVLKLLTDEALVKAISNYPFLVDIYLYGNSVEDGITASRVYFSALNELLSRKTASKALQVYGIPIAEANLNSTSPDSSHSSFVANALIDILEYVDKDIDVIITADTNSEDVSLSIATTPITPNGSTVDYFSPSETHSTAYHANIDKQTEDTYGVTLYREGSCKYNCHSYAWHDRSSSNIYWIDYPTPYMIDGSYSCVYSGNVTTSMYDSGINYGDIIYYANGSHSGVFIGISASFTSLARGVCRSKWGTAGVFEHALTDVPAMYLYSNITIWR